MNAPLSGSHLAAVNRALTTLSDIQVVISKCKNCGIDLQDAQAMIDQQREVLLGLKREFLTPQDGPSNPSAPRAY